MDRKLLTDEAERLEEDLKWSMTSNFQIATWWRWLHWVVGLPSVVIASATGVAAVKNSNPELVATLAVLSAVLGGLSTFMNPQRSAREFHNAGVRLNALLGKVRRFRQIDLQTSKQDDGALRKMLEKLADDKAHLMDTTPHIGGLPYWLAKRSIGKKHNEHQVDQKV